MPRLTYLTAQIRAAYFAASGATLLSALLLPALLPASAQAAPVDPVVRAGTATFAVNGNVYTVTNSPNAIIDWRQFNVANGELLRFLQQNPQSVVLNRVTGNDPSQLFGMLQSNGRVLLVNPNGILFGPNASVDVAGLIASTLNLSDADFLAGRMAFSGGGALLQNQGRITTPLGGSVMLVGSDVTNSGVITAPGGRILLAAGQSVQLADSGTPGLSVTLKADGNKALNLGELHAQGGSIDIYGALIDQQGVVRADSAAVDAYGNIVLKATGATTVSGAVSAANSAGTGGTVQVLGDHVTLSGTARIDASGEKGGGTVLVGGDLHGANAAVANAATATVAAGARIAADATNSGDGGKVVVWANDKTDFAGSIFARGGAAGGNGGQVETSGKQLSFEHGYVNTLAPKGVTGNWLLDPAVFCFYVSSASECTGAAAAGATSFNQLGNILVASGGTVQATDFITFLPSGGSASVSSSTPPGLTLNVKAPYIQVGNGSSIDTQAVAIRLDASNAYGATTQTSASGANLTGSIDIGGHLGSNADQTLLATGDINLRHGGTNFTDLHMFAPGGTQTITAGGQILLQAGAGNDASGNARNTAFYSDGAQVINAGKLILQGGNTASAPNTFAEITAQGNQTITANEITLLGGLSGRASLSDYGAGKTQTINAGTVTMLGGGGTSDSYAQINSAGNQAITVTTLSMRGGVSGTNNWAAITVNNGTDATQTIKAGTMTMDGGAGGTSNYATINADGTRVVQNVTADSLLMKGGGGTQTWTSLNANDAAGANQAKQTLNIKTIALSGGSGADNSSAGVSGNSTQTVRADNISLTGGAGNNATAYIGTQGDQSVTATQAITLRGGSTGTGANVSLNAGGNQSVTASSLSITGGASGTDNNANVSVYGGTDKTQTINAGSITMTGGSGGANNWAGMHADGTRVTQNVTAESLVMKGGGGTRDTWGHLWAYDTAGAGRATQNINIKSIAMTGGSGADSSDVAIGGNGIQTVLTNSIALTGGAGNHARAGIGTDGDQSVNVTNAIALQGGTAEDGASVSLNAGGNQSVTAGSLSIKGGATGSNNNANVSVYGGTDKTQTVNASAITMTGGAEGSNNWAGLQAGGSRVVQNVTATGALTLTGGNGGSGNWVHLWSNDDSGANSAKQTVNAGSIAVSAGSGAGADAQIGGNASQEVRSSAITLTGGSADSNGAQIGTAGSQRLAVSGAIAMNGGTAANGSIAGIFGATQDISAATLALKGGGAGANNGANINASAGTQTILADTLTIDGGAGGSNNGANVSANGGIDTLQKITVKTLAMTGGAGGANNIAGLHTNGTRVTQEVNADTLTLSAGNGASDWAHIAAGYQDATPSTQRINAAAITLTGGAGTAADNAANALILGSGTQAIKGGSLTLTAGVSNASVQNRSGTQSMELTGALTATGGKRIGASAFVTANGGQSITADSITLNAGTDTNNLAYLSQSGAGANDQVITANRVALTAGSGLNSEAGIYKSGSGKQTIVIKGGGSMTLQAGAGETLPTIGEQSDYCNGCKLSSNNAMIYADAGSSQLIDFVAGGTLTLTGGAKGTSNAALIITASGNGGTQTITSSGGAANYPVISMTGGSGGFYNAADGANEGNVAAIGSFDASAATTSGPLKTINAKSITLNGGGTANGRGGALLAAGQGNSIINVTGDLVMNGGAASAAPVIPANPATAYWPDFGSFAGITARGNVGLQVGGNLVMHGGTGITSSAGILLTNGGKLTANIAGATRMDAGAAAVAIGTGVVGADTYPRAGTADIALSSADSFTTSTFASSSKYFSLEGAINVIGANPDAQLVGSYSGGTINGPGWQALGAKPIVAEIYASDGVDVGDNAGINTPNGSWIAVLGKNAAASAGASLTTLDYNTLATHGYQWTKAAYDSGNAQEFRFVLPDNSPIVETHADQVIAQSACVSNPALCVTPPIAGATPASAVAPVVIDVKLTGGVDETPLSASLAQNKAETPAQEAAPAPKAQGPRVAAREKEQERAEEDKKSTAELKREARDSAIQAKASQEAARKAAALAQKEALEAKRVAAAAAKTEAQASRAAAAVTAAEGDLRAAQADARDARAAIAAASTPAQKNQAQLRLATAEAARAGAEAKLAEAQAKRAELVAQGSEAGARGAQAESVAYDARAREAAAEAWVAGAAHAEALLRAREAKDPAVRVAAQRLADDKRIEATQHTAESGVRQSFADDLRFASEQAKVQADARQAQAQAAQALALARRDEQRMQRAIARSRQEDVAGKGASARSAQGGKEAAERLVALETKRAEASQAAANAKVQAAEAKQRKAEEGMAEVARRDDARRERAVKAFVAGANASLTASQLASQAALRHEYKGLLFKDALKVLEQNGRAADLPACGGNISNNCMPSFAQARMEWPTGRPLVRKPVAAYLPQIERKVAIVIGINRYADQRIPQLETAVPDATAVAAQLETSMGYETRVLQNPGKAEIVAALQNVARELDPKDSLVVYYAGHGYLRPVQKGQPQGYWIPSDGSVSSPANWISNTDVSKLLANIPAKQVMLVSDSCYSGTFSREQKVAAAGDASSILARRSVTVMSSGGEEPVSDEGVEGHSIFAWSLMQSMKKVGQVEPGTRVFDATRDQVTAAYPQVPQYGAAVSAGHAQGGDYLFETRTYK